MGTALIISLLLFAFTAFAISRRQRRSSQAHAAHSFAPPHPISLFDDQATAAREALDAAGREAAAGAWRAALLARAARGDHATLAEAQAEGDAALYREALDALVARSWDSAEGLRALASYLAEQREWRASTKLAERLIEAWEMSPGDKRSLAAVLHTAALAADAATFDKAVSTALRCWREGRLPGLSAAELRALVETEFWVLAPEARRSGAGFILKRQLVNVRRELAAATRRV